MFKPLACRLFPFTFSRKEGEWAVGVRFACPAVASNEGDSLASYRKQLYQLAQEVKEKTTAGNERTGLWKDRGEKILTRAVQFIRETVCEDTTDLDQRLVCALRLFGVMEMAEIEELEEDITWDRLGILRDAAFAEEKKRDADSLGRWSGPQRGQFLQLLALYARRDEERTDSWTWRARVQRFLLASRFMLGKGSLRQMGQHLPDAPLSLLGEDSFLVCAEACEPIGRFLRVKLETHQFFGNSHHGLSLKEGLLSLWMSYPVAGALARLYAGQRGRRNVEREDAVKAVSTVDHGFSHMKGFGVKTTRRLVRSLAEVDRFRRTLRYFGFSVNIQ